jgi:SAM-dependent methyltransferase
LNGNGTAAPAEAPPVRRAADGQDCPACGHARFRTLFHSTDRLYRTTAKHFEVVECADCRLIRLYPQPSPAELRTYYPEDYWFRPAVSAADRLEEIYRRFVLGDHVRFVRRAIANCGESGPLLDVGCGGGLFPSLMAAAGQPVAGLDFSCDAASIAWRHHGVPVVCASLSRAPFAPSSFAAVTMFHVLEHLYDPASYLDSAHALLKPKGRLIVQVPNAACWQFLMFGENWNGIDVPRHLIDFKKSDIAGLLDSRGFEVLRFKHFSLRDNPAGLATTLAPGLDPMARRVRRTSEIPRAKLLKDLAYMALVIASAPFTLVEACCRAGSTIMIEARKKT